MKKIVLNNYHSPAKDYFCPKYIMTFLKMPLRTTCFFKLLIANGTNHETLVNFNLFNKHNMPKKEKGKFTINCLLIIAQHLSCCSSS